jgi:hypothetical protein
MYQGSGEGRAEPDRSRYLPLSGLNHTAWLLPVYASQSQSPFPTQHSVLGCWPALPDGTLTR